MTQMNVIILFAIYLFAYWGGTANGMIIGLRMSDDSKAKAD